jgi:L-rhamnose mutarotase
MLQALADTGWRNYSLFCGPDGAIIGYVEADDLQVAQRGMAATEVNARWQEQMSRFFVGLDGRPPDLAFEQLEEIFNLDDQLAAARARTTETKVPHPPISESNQ